MTNFCEQRSGINHQKANQQKKNNLRILSVGHIILIHEISQSTNQDNKNRPTFLNYPS